jgi:hypothetical protein
MVMSENPRILLIEKSTGILWPEWISFMDSINAENLRHPEIAKKVKEHIGDMVDNPAWWAQAVTVAYEQYTGRRLPGQTADGLFQCSISKSTSLSMIKLMELWTEFAAKDIEVVMFIVGEIRKSGTEKRLYWRTKSVDAISITVTSEPKSNGTASLVVALTGAKTTAQRDHEKARWTNIVNRFISELQ